MKIQKTMTMLGALNFIAMLTMLFLLPKTVPLHVSVRMIVDSVGSPWILLVFALMPLLCAIGMYIEMRVRGTDYKNRKPLTITLFLIECFFIYIGWIMYTIFSSGLSLGEKFNMDMGLLVVLPMGFLMIAMGNYLPTIKQNKTLGIKTKSTLSNETVWNKTHRLGGWITVLSGFLIAIGAVVSHLVKIEWLSIVFLGVAVIAITLIPMIYAKYIFRRIVTL